MRFKQIDPLDSLPFRACIATIAEINQIIAESGSMTEACFRLDCTRLDLEKYAKQREIELPVSSQGRKIDHSLLKKTYEEGGIDLVCDRFEWDRTNARKHLRRTLGKVFEKPSTY